MSLSQVVAATASGALYDTVPSNLSTLASNNGGSATKVTTTDLVSGVAILDSEVGVFGSTVVYGVGTEKSLSAGVFAYDNESPVAKKLTTSLSTVSNNYLLSGAADPTERRSIHKLEVLRSRLTTTAIREGYWNEYTGQFDPGYPLVVTDSLGTDNAANPSRSVPGRLSFAGQSSTTTTNYSEKTG